MINTDYLTILNALGYFSPVIRARRFGYSGVHLVPYDPREALVCVQFVGLQLFVTQIAAVCIEISRKYHILSENKY